MPKVDSITRSRIQKIERLLNDNQTDQAIEACDKLLSTKPRNAYGWLLRAIALRNTNRLNDALDAVLKARSLPLCPQEAIKIHGSIAQMTGDIKTAIQLYEIAVSNDSQDAIVWFWLGNAYRETGELSRADIAYKNAININPDYLEALTNRGALLTILGDKAEATHCLSRAAKINPGLPQVQCNLAVLYIQDNQEDKGEAILRNILAKTPDFVDAINALAELLEKRHELDEARSLVEKGLQLAPAHLSLQMVAAKIDRHLKQYDAAIDRLEKLRENLPNSLQQDALLLLGQLYDKKKIPDKAFEYLSEGNRLKQKTMLKEAEASQHYIERIHLLRERFKQESPQYWNPLDGDNFADTPIFLYGFPRSGTTLLETILDSHPKLQALSEEPTIQAVENALGDRRLSDLKQEDIIELRTVYFSEVDKRIQRDHDKILVDKMPLNTVQAHLIWRLFPYSKCILAIRHPCDAVFSCFMQNFTLNMAMSTFFTLENTADAYAGVMALWKDYINVLPIQYHRLRYEDLVADTETETKKLFEFLELDWRNELLRHDIHAKSRRINTPSYHQVTQPIYQDATYRWKRYEKYMTQAIKTLQPYIDYFDY